jgi:hypothetical protein
VATATAIRTSATRREIDVDITTTGMGQTGAFAIHASPLATIRVAPIFDNRKHARRCRERSGSFCPITGGTLCRAALSAA